MAIRQGPFSLPWVAKIHGYRPDEGFEDTQETGPFAYWHHRHTFSPMDSQNTLLQDTIEYTLPGGWFGNLLGKPWVEARLRQMFAYRHRVTMKDMVLHHQHEGGSPMKIAVSGASGLVGSELSAFLTAGGHQVFPLVRTRDHADPNSIYWDPETGQVDKAKLEGLDALVHLAGENIASGRWTESKKDKIRDSRVQGTRFLCEALATLKEPPKALIAASAIGYYGSRGEEVLTEKSPPGKDFLSNVCHSWEQATDSARRKGIRVVNMRIGVILTPKGGALEKMLLPFQLGAGSPLGNGQQYMSWITLDDVVGALYHAIQTETLQGPVNTVAPNPVSNQEFTHTLARVLSRPALAPPVPGFVLSLLLGEMAEALLLSSAWVNPLQLKQSGYTFQYPALEDALRHVLGKPARDKPKQTLFSQQAEGV
jgi:uncharacterized protein (TIGR01777 family)